MQTFLLNVKCGYLNFLLLKGVGGVVLFYFVHVLWIWELFYYSIATYLK